MAKASDNVFPRFLISEGGSTATPAAGRVTIYAKADGLLYSKDDAGAETLVSGGTGGAAAFVGVFAYNNTTQVLGAAGVLALNSEEFDTSAFHDNATNNSRLTVPASQGGKYQIIGHVYNSVSASRDIYIRKNGANLRGGYITINTVSAIVSVIADLAVGDYIEIYADSAGTYGHATDGSLQVTLSMHKLG